MADRFSAYFILERSHMFSRRGAHDEINNSLEILIGVEFDFDFPLLSLFGNANLSAEKSSQCFLQIPDEEVLFARGSQTRVRF